MTKLYKLKPGPQLGYIVVFGASDWERVEKAYGQTLPDRARKLISVATYHLRSRLLSRGMHRRLEARILMFSTRSNN